MVQVAMCPTREVRGTPTHTIGISQSLVYSPHVQPMTSKTTFPVTFSHSSVQCLQTILEYISGKVVEEDSRNFYSRNSCRL
jgi:hypothetical protein